MQEPSRPVAVQKLRRAKRSRDTVMKGTALLLLVVFGTTTLFRFFGPGFVLWLAGGIGAWMLISTLMRHRPRAAERSRHAAASRLLEIERMEGTAFLEQAIGVLQAQGYETQIQHVADDSATYLQLVRGDERVWCLVEYASVDEAVIKAAIEASKKTEGNQVMVLSPHKSSAHVQGAALQQGVVLIDQEEFLRLRSLQVKGHRVHAFRSGEAHRSPTRLPRRER